MKTKLYKDKNTGVTAEAKTRKMAHQLIKTQIQITNYQLNVNTKTPQLADIVEVTD